MGLLTLNSSDWQAIGSMFQGIGTLGGAIAVWWVARRAVNDWRDQKQVEHQIQAAHTVMLAVHDLAHASYKNTYLFLKMESIESEIDYKVVKRLIECQPIERDAANELRKIIPIARTYFGEKTTKSLEEMQHQFESQIGLIVDLLEQPIDADGSMNDGVVSDADVEFRLISGSVDRIAELREEVDQEISIYIRKMR